MTDNHHEQLLDRLLDRLLDWKSYPWGQVPPECVEAAEEIKRLRRALTETRGDAADLQFTFDLQWEADMRAVKCWRERHPGNDLRMPDRCDMVVWLLEEFAKVSAADRWRDISTAPKDGTEIILGFVGGASNEGRWRDGVGNYWKLAGFYFSDDDVLSAKPCEPTHWMQLPKPPEPPEEK